MKLFGPGRDWPDEQSNHRDHDYQNPLRGGEDAGEGERKTKFRLNDRPHPGPLLQERENHSPLF